MIRGYAAGVSSGMNKIRVLSLCACLGLAALLALGIITATRHRRAIGGPTPGATTAPLLTWDFTRGSGLDAVGWPPSVAEPLWRVDEPATIKLVAPDGQRGEFSARSFQVRREGNRVTSILISMQNEDSPAAYARAKALAEEWGIFKSRESAREAQRRLDQWYAGYKPGGTGKGVRMCELIENNVWPPRTVLIRSSYDDSDPWFVGLALGRLHQPPATTQSDAGR
jgi:hypothetical protein